MSKASRAKQTMLLSTGHSISSPSTVAGEERQEDFLKLLVGLHAVALAQLLPAVGTVVDGGLKGSPEAHLGKGGPEERR